MGEEEKKTETMFNRFYLSKHVLSSLPKRRALMVCEKYTVHACIPLFPFIHSIDVNAVFFWCFFLLFVLCRRSNVCLYVRILRKKKTRKEL